MISGNLRRKWLQTAAIGMAACLLCIGTATQAAAQAPGGDPGQATPAAPDPDKVTLNFFKGTEVGGLVDAYYDWYSTKADGVYRNFDTKHNAFSLSMAEVWLAKAPAADSRVGYKVKLAFGPTTSDFVTSAADSSMKNIQEAYGSYLAPVGKGLQIDVGKFVTHNGAEVIEAKDNWNYSRSLLFAWAIPYYHSGIRLTYSPTDKVTLAGGVVNGWNNVVENNTGKTVWGQVMIKPIPALSIVENYTGGPEQANDNSDWRSLSDTIATYTVNPMVSVMANYDYGRDTVAGSTVSWQGIAGYVKVQANKWVAVIPRAEYYNDPNGFTLGTTQKIGEGTLTVEVKGADNFLWRIEYRGDFSNKSPFFDSTGKSSKNQHSIAFGFLYSFSSKS
jgi:hypothetical protein